VGLHAKTASVNEGPDSEFAATVASLPPGLDGSLPDPLPPVTEPPPGDDLAGTPTLQHIGRYALKRKLGEGGLGNVYEAWDPLLSRTVAVKTLQFDLVAPERLALDRLFLNEARAVASLSHPHIVTVHDAGLSAHGVYIAMERLRGRDLRQAIAGGWRPTPVQAAQLVRRVADALAYAHARGVVHCDIKPANIFLTRKDKPTVLDFGIARIAQGTRSAVQPGLEGLIAGSPHYLAPEQLEGGTIDGRTDVYSLGVVLYELLAGRKAFEGDSLAQITNAVMHANPAPADSVRPGVPAGLAAVAARAMARDPAGRYASAADLALALRPWQERPSALGDAPASPAAARRRLAVLLPMLGAAVLLGAGSTWWLRDQVEPIPAAVAAQADTPPTAAATAPGPAETALPPAAGDVPADAAASAPAEVAVAPAPTPTPKPRARPKPATPPAVAAQPAAPPPPGVLRVAVSPWGEVEVDGRAAGITPPLVSLELPAGPHRITIRNGDFPPYTAQVEVNADRPVTVRHRFGS
jgi:eukaryotic-like serine/threonine-protein kinase